MSTEQGKILQFSELKVINVQELTVNTRKIQAGLIAPAKETVAVDLAPEHAAEPIKNLEDINRITEYLVRQHAFHCWNQLRTQSKRPATYQILSFNK